MTKTVYKYPVKDRERINLPKGAEILEFGFQDEVLFVWALIDLDEPENEWRYLVLLGTGEHSEELDENYRFINTFRTGRFVLHGFELTT